MTTLKDAAPAGAYGPGNFIRRFPSAFRLLLRFAVVGIAQNGVSFLALVGLTQIGMQPWLGFALVFPIAVIATYWFNSRWTFGDRRKPKLAPLAYAMVYLSAYCLCMAMSYGLEQFGIQDWLNAFLTIGATGVFTFVVLNNAVFKP